MERSRKMSWQPAKEPAVAAEPSPDPVETAIVPRTRDLGDGFQVRRVLPFVNRRMVGPFIFFDAMGPTLFEAGHGLDVRPHPHIGLATVTYLFAGEVIHRDSLGNVQPIRPGDVNWMTAGGAIAHFQRSDRARRARERRLSGIQSWVALPSRDEESAPAFAHHPGATLPVIDGEGKRVRLIAGELFGARAPGRTFSAMFYADVSLDPGARLALPAEHEERAAFLIEGGVDLAGQTHAPGQLLVFRPGAEIVLAAP